MELQAKLLDARHAVLLYGTTPPRAGSSDAAVREIANKLVERLAGLPLDGIVVYDIQDESRRTPTPRPFAFSGTIEPRAYSRLLAQLSGKPVINYKCVGTMDETAWNRWLRERS